MRCHIVGFDGFDLDVLFNMSFFYSECGYSISFSREPRDADVLVIQRGKLRNQYPAIKVREVHAYEYVGEPIGDVTHAFPAAESVITIFPSLQNRYRAGGRVVEAFPPVMPELWRRKDDAQRSRADRAIHISHFKKMAERDNYATRLLAAVRDGRIEVWGAGWTEPCANSVARLHGPASLHDCQALYASAHIAIGLMYPFQRASTFSGRMWQAPLNGCALISEPAALAVNMPGVIAQEAYVDDIDVRGVGTPSDIVDAAISYWSSQTDALREALQLTAAKRRPRQNRFLASAMLRAHDIRSRFRAVR